MYLSTFNISNPEWPAHNSLTAAAVVLNDIAHAKDNMLVSAALSVDLSKLLDTVDGVQEISAI